MPTAEIICIVEHKRERCRRERQQRAIASMVRHVIDVLDDGVFLDDPDVGEAIYELVCEELAKHPLFAAGEVQS